MALSIIKFNKDLSFVDSEDIEVSSGMTIDQFGDVLKIGNAEIPFIISSTNRQIPFIEEEEFCIVIREKVDFTAQGPNDVMIKNRDKDVGNSDNKERPYKPAELPPGFVELKSKE